MKKTAILALLVALGLYANADVKKYDFKDFDVHVYTSSEPMQDVSILVEGKDGLVMIEPQSFYKSIEDFNKYIETLNKPLQKVVANYHAGGLANYDISKVVMIEPMVEFMKSPQAQGMLKHFDKAFKGAMDTRMIEVKNTIPANSKQNWAGVDFIFSSGSTSDFPASSINIGNKAYYMHFSPNKMHPSPFQVTSPKAIEATLVELKNALKSGAEIFVGSHGPAATKNDVIFLIAYFEKLKELKDSNKDVENFVKALKKAYPNLAGSENIEPIAQKLYTK